MTGEIKKTLLIEMSVEEVNHLKDIFRDKDIMETIEKNWGGEWEKTVESLIIILING